jgi:hypothetical protein
MNRLIPLFRLAEQDEYLTNSQSFNEAGSRSLLAGTPAARNTKKRRKARQLRVRGTACARDPFPKTHRPRKPKLRGRRVFY